MVTIMPSITTYRNAGNEPMTLTRPPITKSSYPLFAEVIITYLRKVPSYLPTQLHQY